MSSPSHEFRPVEEELQVFIVSTAQQTGLETSHPYVLAIAEANYRAARFEQALIAAEETVRQQDAEREELIYDHDTGLLLFGPAIKLGNLLLNEVNRNLNSPDVDDPRAPNALMAAGIDIEALHIINNRWGDTGGDAAIGAAADTLIDAADYLNATFRTQERREAIWRRGEVPRHTDIIARRQKGDELFALVAFHESPDFPRLKMQEITERRFKYARRPNGKRLYLHSAVAFFDPDIDKNVEGLLERADPKAITSGEKAVRFWRKIGRAATLKY